MKIFVMVDMEGISGVYQAAQCWGDGPAFTAARTYVTNDINACADGCFKAGARRVTVLEAHGVGSCVAWETLDPRVDCIKGGAGSRMPGLAEYDGLILLGYHAMSGTKDAILSHTMSSKGWQSFWMNGKLAGEIAIDAAIAGDAGVPTIMVSGDDKACVEARKLIKGIATAEVKKGLGQEGGILLSKERAGKAISDSAAKAVSLCGSLTPYKVRHPVKMRLELAGVCRPPVGRTNIRLLDSRTFEVTGRTVEEALNRL